MSTPQPPSPAGPDDERGGMSGLQRAMIVLGAIAVLLLAFVLVQSGGDDEDGGTTAAQTTATQQPTTATTTTTETETTTTTETETTTTEEPAEPTVPTIRVNGGEPQGGVRTLSFESGERIRFKVRSDAADEVHVHGYDETKAVPANQTVQLSFDASIEGRFEVEFHEAGTQIAELEVSPS
jgi:hypothetical protein